MEGTEGRRKGMVSTLYEITSADSGFIAGVGTPVICGVGPIGGNYHRADEWMEIDSLAERAKFIAETILALASQPTKTNL